MRENAVVVQERVRELAERMVRRYVRGLLSVDELAERLLRAWRSSMPGEDAQGPALEALARGICSQVLWEACQLSGGWQREVAFERLNDYLEHAFNEVSGSLRYAFYETREEVLQQTHVEILQCLQRERGRPEQPMAFLGWARVILRRQLSPYWRPQPCQTALSLEEQEDSSPLEIEDERAPNPLHIVLSRELREELCEAIGSLRNPRYRAVLLRLYLGEMEICEVAEHLRVPIADIYLWHHRALKALHKKLNPLPERRTRRKAEQ
jgi:RNA polymerase sigma factor (sigma-70 family)